MGQNNINPDFALAKPLLGQAKSAQRAACLDKVETCGVNPCGKPQPKANFAFPFLCATDRRAIDCNAKFGIRKICVVSGSRADYGHLQSVMRACALDSSIDLQIIVTGSHLAKEQGQTYRQIQKDGFKVHTKVNISKFDDSSVGITKRIALACQGFADAFVCLSPDIVVVLGDRYEILAATIAAYVGKRIIAHLHGGESSEGALDEGFRHAITKMAHLHFAATEDYRRRIIQLGEEPQNVFNFGAPGLDALHRIKLLSKDVLSSELKFDLKGRCAIVTFHPETLDRGLSRKPLDEILKAIEAFDLKVIFTKANMDAEAVQINKALAEFCKKNPLRYRLVDNLGVQKYWSCLASFDLMMGNSSSGIIEAPSFSLPVINVGDRQKGRVRAKNIIDVAGKFPDIRQSIAKALSSSFKKSLRAMKNPYQRFDDGKSGWRIKEQLKAVKMDGDILKKKFFNISR